MAYGFGANAGNLDFGSITAIGANSQSTGGYSTAIGASSDASGVGATATGELSSATRDRTTATGWRSQATGLNSVALGAYSAAKGKGSVALGAHSVATATNVVSVGSGNTTNHTTATRRIVNVSKGVEAADAATIAQVNEIISASNDTATLKDTVGTTEATVYTTSKTNALLSTKANSSTVTALGTTVKANTDALATKADSADVYTKTEINDLALDTIGERTGKETTLTQDIEAIQKSLDARRSSRRADSRQRATAEASLHATTDTVDDKSEITVSKSEIAVTRGDGKVVFDADNDGTQGSQTTIRGGTATTALILDD
ncbi:hypothetical protein LN050_07330 [Comamonadaceae bacterium M7527]|nr:hypothetical protein LN050_07330 [Comamonadaceae bacterium M7527]